MRRRARSRQTWAMARLFVAIDLPSAVRAQLAALGRGVAGAKWVTETQLHVTLRFIGDAGPELQASLERELSAIRWAPFEVALAGVGQFPGRGQARVLWAGVSPPAPLASLAERVERAVVAAGCAPEARTFAAHVTLARLRDAPSGAVREFQEANAGLSSQPFAIEEFLLYSSVLGPRGATHHVEGRYPLVAAP